MMLSLCRGKSAVLAMDLSLSIPQKLFLNNRSILKRTQGFRFYNGNRPWRVQNLSPRQRSTNQLFGGNNLLYGIIGINCGVYGCWYSSTNNRNYLRLMYDNFTLSSFGIFKEYRLHTLISSFFSHKDGMHLLSNMVTLYFFGAEALSILGASRFAALYFGGGLLSSCCFALWPILIPKSWPSSYRSSSYTGGLGASGTVHKRVMICICVGEGFTVLLLYL